MIEFIDLNSDMKQMLTYLNIEQDELLITYHFAYMHNLRPYFALIDWEGTEYQNTRKVTFYKHLPFEDRYTPKTNLISHQIAEYLIIRLNNIRVKGEPFCFYFNNDSLLETVKGFKNIFTEYHSMQLFGKYNYNRETLRYVEILLSK